MASISCPQNILVYLEERLGAVKSIIEAKSAQQRVLILFFPDYCSSDLLDENWRDALKSGRKRVVVRIWKGASRWWNLNHVCSERAELQQIAEHEVWGYRSARQALQKQHCDIRIPRVLFFSSSHDNVNPWAVMEYVGPDSTLYTKDSIVPDYSWTDGMAKIRDEFGFMEPHPRWGRVPVKDSLEYAISVLQSVMLPIHYYYFSNHHRSLQSQQTAISYVDMIRLYKEKYKTITANGVGGFPEKRSNDNDKLQAAIMRLGKAIDRLEDETLSDDKINKTPPPVLCHMDCQPQNLLFAHDSTPGNSFIVSVLDWEEAAYADPRFDLLMLCRKVCANKAQADKIWRKYQEETKGTIELGNIEPWLKLETVHSLSTLLLQATAGGGRSPWESKPDLWGKIEREFQRLARTGWTFCDPHSTA